MARQFAPRHFLRMALNAHQEEYFHSRNLLLAVSFQGRDESEIDDVFNAWQNLEPSLRAVVDADFRAIDSIATDAGAECIFREARFMGIDTSAFGGDIGHHDRAFEAFLRHPELFERVHQLADVDELPVRYWQKRNDLPEVTLNHIDADTEMRLGRTLSYYFRESEGRGQVCVVEPMRRDDAIFFFCYLEDWGRVEKNFGENGTLERLARRPAFEVIFIVSPNDCSLDTFFHGKKSTVDQLDKLFFRTVFGFDIPAQRDRPVFELNCLKDRSFQFLYDPASGITGVVIKQLKFATIGGARRRLTIEADPSKNTLAIYDFMDEVFDTIEQGRTRQRLPLAAYNIINARIQVLFHPLPGRRRRTKTFNVGFPSSYSLSHDPEGSIIRDMLRRSGIEQLPTPSAQGSFSGNGVSAG